MIGEKMTNSIVLMSKKVPFERANELVVELREMREQNAIYVIDTVMNKDNPAELAIEIYKTNLVGIMKASRESGLPPYQVVRQIISLGVNSENQLIDKNKKFPVEHYIMDYDGFCNADEMAFAHLINLTL